MGDILCMIKKRETGGTHLQITNHHQHDTATAAGNAIAEDTSHDD